MTEHDLTIHSKLGDYPVHFHEGFDWLDTLAALPNRVTVIDRQVAGLYSETLAPLTRGTPVYLLEAAEERKTLDEASRIYRWALDNFAAKRNLNLVSVGGGITQDVTGFVASTLFRGVAWTYVPTTLLAQADSCIGGKTSLNFGSHKNLLGTFYPPKAIHLAPEFARTLSKLDLYSGFGEVAKFLLMRQFESGDATAKTAADLRALVACGGGSADVIRVCLDVKRSFMEADEFDRGRRNLLNYGHCFGHALEAASNYYVPHGVAVNVGIVFANLAAAARGLLPKAEEEAMTREVNLPLLAQPQRTEDYADQPLLDSMKNDKKRTGNALPLVVPVAGGLSKLDDFTEAEFHSTLDALRKVVL